MQRFHCGTSLQCSDSTNPASCRLFAKAVSAIGPVYQEFYFGAGITADSPGCTPFGEPFDVLTIGTTNVPLQLLNRFLDELQVA